MCLMVWLGAARPLPTVHVPAEPDPVVGYFNIEAEPDDAPVRRHFDQPHVHRVGSHEGCGCGFRSQQLGLAEDEAVADVISLLGALMDEERAEFLAEQRSRERLRDLVLDSLRHGQVEVFACWAGDEALELAGVEDVLPDYFAAYLDPLVERTKYLVRSG